MWLDSRVVIPTSCARAPSKCAGPVRLEGLDVHGAEPARAHDLREPLRVILICLVELHFEGRSSVAGVKTDHIQVARLVSSCTSQVVIGPVSIPSRACAPACWRMTRIDLVWR